jgi:GT2 family glycosyltransferase
MSSNIRLLVSCHKQGILVPENSLLRPIQVGAKGKAHLEGMLHDDEGINISSKNYSYCELTGQYWAWKHLEADFYGFLHYRRYFNFSDTAYPIHHEPFIFGDVVFDRNDPETLEKICFAETTMRSVIEAHDFIAPEPIATPDGVNVYDQYKMSAGHHIEDFDTALSLIKARYPRMWPSAERYLNQNKLYVCNMFVMSSKLFNSYSEWLFDILFAHERLCDSSHYSGVGRRVSGYLGERLCGIYLSYLYDSGYDGKNLQRVFFRHPENPLLQGSAEPSRDARIEFGTISRGRGNIYSSLSVPSEFQGDGVVAHARTQGGNPVPAKVVDGPAGKVLVLPVLSVDQTATVEVVDGSASPLASSACTFSPQLTKLRSRGNTLLKNSVARHIRNCDERSLPHDTRVSVLHSIGDVDGTDIIRGEVTVALGPTDPDDAFVEVSVIGSDGSPVGIGDWVCGGDQVVPVLEYPGMRVRRITYSIRMPRVASYVVWAKFPDGEHPDGFLSAEWFFARDSRSLWNAFILPACDDKGYGKWFLESHRASELALDSQRHRKFAEEPVFSIVVPLFKTPIPFLREMVHSVVAQTYVGWELILVNASPEDAKLSREVARCVEADPRVKSVTLPENRGITENTNEGIRAASGDFVSFLDHDDVLEPDCLFHYVDGINKHPDTDLIYCDEDKLENGRYTAPFFKPAWNPDLLLGMNYVCHFLTVRKSIVDTLTPPGSEYDGSQDWHMTFRVGERARFVLHVPRVLYHWRIHDNSTAKSAGQKDYTLESSRLAVKTHLDRMGIGGRVSDSPLSPRRFVVEYDLGSHPLVSIIVPNNDSVKVLNRCLMSVLNHSTYDNFEVVIVENNSSCQETFDYYDEIQHLDPRVRVVTLEGMQTFNFSRIINFGAAHSKGEYLLMLNNDTEVISPNWIEELLGPCMRGDVGATGAKLLFPDGTIQHAGVTFGNDGPCHLNYLLPRRVGGNFESTLLARDVSAVTGACLLTSRQDFDAVGGLDEELAVNYNDVDYCLKLIEAGRLIVFCPTSELYHLESVSRGSEGSGEKALRFRREKGLFMLRWPRYFEEVDPYGNPNFYQGISYERLNPEPEREEWEQ